ncbi:zinc ABC transporter substrate-binding protein [Arthrobacter sp. NQ7]|uniref:metal ABC transporter solute-binding protein, Zn/Mn family n=1 Tax=Arthrobacter sp. NQ7 TaxID=3032303 RepID=UPI00240EFE5A|nr:zinc ABC transporter substrate-binding protein [Arthrobacter sp. NQ7]MDJ0459880.1 zinc ABC transporter substrate-binding protein [Arthrobacter sp. NQ7]
MTTSTDVYADIAQTIGGGRIHVTPIIHSVSQDPHSYEATAQDKLAVSKARVLIENGGGYDNFFKTLVADNRAGDQRLINVTELSGLAPQAGTASPGAPAGTHELNEHLWYNFQAMTATADAITQELSRVDPAGSSTFAANADRFKAGLGKLKDRTAELKASHEGDPVAITEPVPLYLLEAAGLVNKTPEDFSNAIEDGHDVPVPVQQQTLDLISGKAVKMLAYNEQTEGPQTKKLKDAAAAAGVPVVDFTETLPEGKNYLQWMGDNVEHLEQALQP